MLQSEARRVGGVGNRIPAVVHGRGGRIHIGGVQ